MFKIPTDITGPSRLQENMLQETLRYQELIEQALGYRADKFLQPYLDEQELFKKLAHPELDLIEAHRNLMSGAAADQKAMEDVMRPSLDELQSIARANEQWALVPGLAT